MRPVFQSQYTLSDESACTDGSDDRLVDRERVVIFPTAL